jgi:hypothetical protein
MQSETVSMSSIETHSALLTPSEIVRGLAPIDWEQMRMMASLTPAQRVLTGMKTSDIERLTLRETLRPQFPELSLADLNMVVLARLTPVRLDENAPSR